MPFPTHIDHRFRPLDHVHLVLPRPVAVRGCVRGGAGRGGLLLGGLGGLLRGLLGLLRGWVSQGAVVRALEQVELLAFAEVAEIYVIMGFHKTY